ncbi:MAG: hypothetical protein IJW31_09165 [Lentisphaeria bacterium]|nr:hypothetical protein [Lentisphaeria bacterium]
MKLKKSATIKCLMVVSILPCIALAAEKTVGTIDAAEMENQRKFIENEAAHRNVVLDALWATRTKIQDLVKDGKYQEADVYYKELIEQLATLKGSAAKEKLELLKKERYDMQTAWIDSIVEKAKKLADAKEYEEAKAVAATISTIDSARGAEIAQKLIDYYQSAINGQNYRVVSDITDPDWQKYPVVENMRLSDDEQRKIKTAMTNAEEALLLEDYDRAAAEVSEILTLDVNNTRAQKILEKTYAPRISKLLLEAETYMKNNYFDEAIKSLEKVYLIDPYNIKASTLLARAYAEVFSFAKKRHHVDSEKLVGMAEWGWVEPVKVESENVVKDIKTEVKLDKNPLMEEMERIIFPKFEVADSDIIEIIDELRRRAKIFNNGKSVDMILKVVDGNPKFTKKSSFAFSNMPLSEILRYVTLNYGLKYKLEDDTVIIGDGIDNLILKSFTVRDDLIAAMMNDEITAAAAVEAPADDMGGDVPGGEEGSAFGDDTEAAAPANSNIQKQSKAIMDYFRARGIEFPAGSSAFYTPRTTKLSIRNTEENLRKLGELLEQLMIIETPMVMTDVKIIQVTENNFEELGFNWDFTLDHGDDWKFALTTAGVGETPNLRTGGTGISDAERTDTALIKDINIFPKLDNKIFGATPNLKLTVYALSENGRAEILSTPRLISKSGTKASIKLVTKSKYPESWDEPDTESSNENTTSISFPVPELSDFIEQGIRLTVTPEVSPDNRTINLELRPEIISIITESPDSTYNFTYEQGIINSAGERIPSQVTVMPIWMPETNIKEIHTKLKVYDGETIMIGGVMQNETSRRLDKLPLFGDIPFLGRLFQNRAEDSTKVNYLIFVTARLVNHTGRPVNPLINTATPTFNF